MKAVWKIFLVVFLGLQSCTTTPIPEDPTAEKFLGAEMWVATNLRVTEGQYIDWENNISGTILSVNTPIRFTEINSENAVFVDNDDKKYILKWRGPAEKGYGEVFEQEFHKYFSKKPLDAEIGQYSSQQVQAISVGQVERGMTKKTVLFSLGWPPSVKDPEKSDLWVYQSQWSKKAIRFKDGVVIDIIQSPLE